MGEGRRGGQLRTRRVAGKEAEKGERRRTGPIPSKRRWDEDSISISSASLEVSVLVCLKQGGKTHKHERLQPSSQALPSSP